MGNKEGILHIPCWMIFCKVKCLENVQSSSISGPSATLKPKRAKMRITSSRTVLEGADCLVIWGRESDWGLYFLTLMREPIEPMQF